jgi:hypothetical protein
MSNWTVDGSVVDYDDSRWYVDSLRPSFGTLAQIFPGSVVAELGLGRTCCFHLRGNHVLIFTVWLHVRPQSVRILLRKHEGKHTHRFRCA